MSAHGDSHSQGHGVRYEREDISPKPVVAAVASLTVFTLVFTGIAWLVFQGLAAREAANSPPRSPLAERYAATQPPEPRLQADPKADLVALRTAEARELSKLAWVDKAAGTVQVPIERAMEMLLAKGLPSRQGSVPKKMSPPAGTAPSQFTAGAGAPDWQGAHAPAAGHGSGHAAPSHGSGHADAGHGKAPAAEAHGH